MIVGTTCIVKTPVGFFIAEWDEDDEIPVRYRGQHEAISYFANYLAIGLVTNRDGFRLTSIDFLQPIDLVGFCQSEKYGIAVIEERPLPFLDDLDEDNEMLVLDSVATKERMQLVEDGFAIAKKMDWEIGSNSPDFFVFARELQGIIEKIKTIIAGTIDITPTNTPTNPEPIVSSEEGNVPPEAEQNALKDAKELIKGAEFKALQRDIINSLASIRSIDNGDMRGFDRASFVNSIVGKLKTRAKQNPFLASVALAWLYEAQASWDKPAITMRNSVWKLTQDWETFRPLFETATRTEDPTGATEQTTGSDTAQTEGKGHSAQYWNYAKWIEDKKPVSQGMKETILADTRLNDGETQELLAMVDANNNPGPNDEESEKMKAGKEAQREADIALMQSVIDETSPDMMNPDLAKQLEEVHERIKNEPDMMELFDRTADAYGNFMVQKAKEVLGIS